MKDSGKERDGDSVIREFMNSEEPAICFARDILWVMAVVSGIALALFLVSGTWPAVVAIESGSMTPNMNENDLVFVVAQDRFGELTTWAEGQNISYAPFGTHPDMQGNMPYGDVIIYQPNGESSVHPIIHRALGWYEGSPHAGYITKGDNNPVIDQRTGFNSIGQIEPVKKEWIVGKALFSIPFVGYFPLHIIEFAIIVILLMFAHEYIMKRRNKNKDTKNTKK
ncbi:MAG: S26 family signal peptidase [Euryarchaeota archaeon]|nr:S26 family signal peptidase [Euryarchaeota archaeon]